MNRFLPQFCAHMLTLPLFLFAATAMADSKIDPEADKILQTMSSYLDSLSSFSVKASAENEIITDEGQKLQLISMTNLAIERPAKVHFARKGMFAEIETLSDGKTFTMYSKVPNVYIQREAPGTIDNVIRLVEFETGLSAPGADMMFADAYSILKSGVTQAAYIGTTVVDGVESHQLAFRENEVDWQLWVKVGKEPLPMKYVITSKWVTAAPQFTIRFHDWNTKAKFPTSEFAFSAPKNSRQVDDMPLDVTIADEADQQ